MLGVFNLLGHGRDLGCLDIAEENVAVEEVEELGQAVPHESAEWHVKDSVELFECLLFGLGNEEKHEEESSYIPRRIPGKGALRSPC